LTKREFNGTNTRSAKAGLVFPFLNLRSLVLLFFFMQCPSYCYSQWRPLLSTAGNFEVIYFLDLPGPPRIGFLGNFDTLYKTTDGGINWKPIIFNDPNAGYGDVTGYSDIAFKDSLTGWVATGFGCFKTTDCGETWNLITINPSGSGGIVWGIYYDKADDGLFLSTWGGAAPVWYGFNELSWDEGITWEPFASVGNENSGGFAFADGNNGLLSWGDYWPASWWRTTDGGHSWNALSFDTACWQPLAIPGTKTYFAVSSPGSVFRTDDAGDTWSLIYSFPPQVRIQDWPDSGQTGSCIRGNLDSLYVMACSGCYLSTDQGLSWKYLCGVPDLRIPTQRFYLKDKLLYVIGYDSANYAQLWMLNMDSLNIFSANFAFPDSTKLKTVTPGQKVTVNFSTQTTDPIGIDSGHIVIHFDSTSLLLDSLALPPTWVIRDSTSGSGYLNLYITADSTLPLPNPIITLTFNTYLSSGTPAFVWLDSANLSGHRLNCDCAVLSTDVDSVQINFEGCGDSLILAAMQNELPFSIQSIVPNPASGNITVSFARQSTSPIAYELYNALGATRLTGSIPGNASALDVSTIPSGIYYLRFSSEGYVQTRSISIKR
jgi:Secretion system C-terminal sorting domain